SHRTRRRLGVLRENPGGWGARRALSAPAVPPLPFAVDHGGDPLSEMRTEPTAVGPARAPWLPRAGAIVTVVVVVLLLGRTLGAYVVGFAEWVEGLGGWGPVVFIAGYAIATVAFVPGSLLTLAAGAVFGLLAGSIYVFVGAVIGSAAAFLVARYVARG